MACQTFFAYRVYTRKPIMTSAWYSSLTPPLISLQLPTVSNQIWFGLAVVRTFTPPSFLPHLATRVVDGSLIAPYYRNSSPSSKRGSEAVRIHFYHPRSSSSSSLHLPATPRAHSINLLVIFHFLSEFFIYSRGHPSVRSYSMSFLPVDVGTDLGFFIYLIRAMPNTF